MKEDFRIVLRAEPRLLCSLRRLVRDYVASFGFEDRLDQIVLAVDEACANAIRHSYQGRHDGTITLTLRAHEGMIDLQLEDEGLPIPVECTRPPDAQQLEADRMTPGGLGVYLIHRAFDEVIYDPGAQRGNRLRMRLYAPSKQEAEHGVDPEH